MAWWMAAWRMTAWGLLISVCRIDDFLFEKGSYKNSYNSKIRRISLIFD